MSDLAATDLALLLLRVGVGLVLVAHGVGKLHGSPGLPATTRWFEHLGFRPARVHALLAAGSELAIGLGLAVGLATTLAAGGLVALMLIAVATVTGRHGFGAERNGWEYNAVLVLVALVVALAGPGRWSLDEALGLRASGPVPMTIAVLVGLAGAGALLAPRWRRAASVTKVAR